MHSIIQSGLTAGGRCLTKDRHSVFFTAVNPIYTHQHQEEVQYYLEKPRIAVCKNNLITHQNTVYWCILKVAQRKGWQYYQTRSNAIALFNTLLATCFENVVYMKTGEKKFNAKYTKGYREPYSRRICIMDVRIFLIPKREHPPTIKAKEARSTRKLVRLRHKETRRGNVDYRNSMFSSLNSSQ